MSQGEEQPDALSEEQQGALAEEQQGALAEEQPGALAEALVRAAEKAACVARAARLHCEAAAPVSDEEDDDSEGDGGGYPVGCARPRVQQKVGSEGNPRFQQDFKTLTDVLVQEMVRVDLTRQFPSLAGCILGEENNLFNDCNGESVRIEILETEEATAQLLSSIVEPELAQELAQLVHEEAPEIDVPELPGFLSFLDLEDVGIWIDPIDCTAEFINGQWSNEPKCLPGTGLQCVTVLIGAFQRSTGEPIIGVINQPFYTRKHSRVVWGCCYGGVTANNLGPKTGTTGDVLISTGESSVNAYYLLAAGWKTSHPSGAGFKLLQVCTGAADGYTLSRDTSYLWDTCAPHAVLRSIGGDIVTFSRPHRPLTYMVYESDETEYGIQKYVNSRGIIAYRHPETLEELIKTFENKLD